MLCSCSPNGPNSRKSIPRHLRRDYAGEWSLMAATCSMESASRVAASAIAVSGDPLCRKKTRRRSARNVTTLEGLRETAAARPSRAEELERPHVRGKFFFANGRKLYVCGTTYGTFELGEEGQERYDPAVVERDFELMAANGINVVRIYTAPPRWL